MNIFMIDLNHSSATCAWQLIAFGEMEVVNIPNGSVSSSLVVIIFQHKILQSMVVQIPIEKERKR